MKKSFALMQILSCLDSCSNTSIYIGAWKKSGFVRRKNDCLICGEPWNIWLTMVRKFGKKKKKIPIAETWLNAMQLNI